MKNFQRMFFLLKPYSLRLVLIVVLNIISVFFSVFSITLLIPFLSLIFGDITLIETRPVLTFDFESLTAYSQYYLSQFIFQHGQISALILLLAVFFLTFLFKNIFLYLSLCLFIPVKNNVIKVLRDNIYKHILILPLSYYSETRKGDVLSRALNDVQEVETHILQSYQQLLKEPIVILLFALMLFFMDVKFTLFVIFFSPFVIFIIFILQKTLKKKSIKAREEQAKMVSLSEESIFGLRIVKAFNAIDGFYKKFVALNSHYTQLTVNIYRKRDLSSPMSEFLGACLVVLILLVGGRMVFNQSNTFTADIFIAYLAMFVQIINPVKIVAESSANLKKGFAAFDRIEDFLQSEEQITEISNPIAISDFKDEISFSNVSFSYEKKPVLENITFTVPKGKTVAICGNSGSGKSTLADLLLRFYDIGSGAIQIDRTDIRDLKISDLRQLFGVVSQESMLFHDTIFNNIAFGIKNTDKKQVANAAKIAGIYDFIDSLEDKFDTLVGDRGTRLSGGQKQRICIARAVLKDAPIFIFDEATSALDSESERLVQDAIHNLMKNKTSIVIAHRLSTIRDADTIIVLENGKIVETGTHEELVARNGIYQKMIEIQNFKI